MIIMFSVVHSQIAHLKTISTSVQCTLIEYRWKKWPDLRSMDWPVRPGIYIYKDHHLVKWKLQLEVHFVRSENFHSPWSHPVGLNGQNDIIAITPLQFLPAKEFEKRQKSIDQKSKFSLMSSMMKIKTDVIDKKKRAKTVFSN